MTEPVFRSTLRLSSGASTDAFGLSRLGETRGFLKMLVDAQSDRILGFAVLGAEGSETEPRWTMESILLVNAAVIFGARAQAEREVCVLIEGDRIREVTRGHLAHGGARVIDVGGKTLMPGLIDAHAHITGLSLSPRNRANSEAEISAAATEYLHNSLMDGFTTLREAGGADYAIARLLDEGKIIGPRLFYSGRALTQTGGGADFRTPGEVTDPCGSIGPYSVMSVIADGVTDVRRAAREELRKGATQIKLFASGGVVFPSSGHSTRYEYSEAELAAIVEEAQARGTYAMAHVYSDEGVRRCLNAGVRSIEHGNFMSAETMARLRDHGAFWDPTFISLIQRVESSQQHGLSDQIVGNLTHTITKGQEIYARAKELKVPICLGTDLWGPEAQQSQIRELEVRLQLDSPDNILASATTVNAELLMQKGELGVIAPGAYADLLVVDGDPLSDLKILLQPRKNLRLIMRAGQIVKNSLDEPTASGGR